MKRTRSELVGTMCGDGCILPNPSGLQMFSFRHPRKWNIVRKAVTGPDWPPGFQFSTWYSMVFCPDQICCRVLYSSRTETRLAVSVISYTVKMVLGSPIRVTNCRHDGRFPSLLSGSSYLGGKKDRGKKNEILNQHHPLLKPPQAFEQPCNSLIHTLASVLFPSALWNLIPSMERQRPWKQWFYEKKLLTMVAFTRFGQKRGKEMLRFETNPGLSFLLAIYVL